MEVEVDGTAAGESLVQVFALSGTVNSFCGFVVGGVGER